MKWLYFRAVVHWVLNFSIWVIGWLLDMSIVWCDNFCLYACRLC